VFAAVGVGPRDRQFERFIERDVREFGGKAADVSVRRS